MIRPAVQLLLICALALCLSACGRPLTPAEQAFMADLTGPGLDPEPIRVTRSPLIGLVERSYPVRPRTTCRERIVPPPEGERIAARTAGIVLFNHLAVRDEVFLEDYVGPPGEPLNLVAAMFFAHEMIHVWQWQNRERTGYHPARAFAEHLATEDPYLFDGDAGFAFLDYGYEQQASLVEEYVCCRALDPEGARTARLARLIGEELTLAPIQRRIDSTPILLPWDGVEPDGICS